MKLKMLTFSLLLTSPSLFAQTHYKFIKNTNFEKLPFGERVKYHELFTKTISSLSKSEKYPNYVLENKVSSIQIYNYLSDIFINDSFAAGSASVCLFGGWPSNKSGTCQVPFQSSGLAVANQIGIEPYDSNDYCGSSNLFRCNPDIFGPGIATTPEITQKYGNINGNKNNSSPFSAGICVDVSKGYNNLTSDCAKISNELDQLRPKPWREDYFASSKHENFQKMQNTIANICEERAIRRANDPMCDQLEESLALTYTAVSAGKIANVNVDDLFPGCGEVIPEALPTCESEDHESLKNLREALSEIQSDQSCRFKSVSAEISPQQPVSGRRSRNAAQTTPEATAPENANQCKIYLAEKLQHGIGGQTNINIFFKGTAVDDIENISVKISPDMTKEQILAAIKSGDNKSSFDNACAVSTCPTSDARGVDVLYQVMEHLRSNKECHFKNIQVMDQRDSFDGNFQKSSCQQSIEGSLAAEGLAKNLRPLMFVVTDAKGDLNTGALLATVNSASTKEGILEQFEQGENKGVYDRACSRTTQGFFSDKGLALKELGIDEGQFIDPSQESLILKLANLKRRGENVEIVIAPNGDILAKPRVAILNETPGMQSYENSDGFMVFSNNFDVQLNHYNAQRETPIPQDIADLASDMFEGLKTSSMEEKNGGFDFTVSNARANLLGKDQDIVNGHHISAKANSDGTYTYSLRVASHEDQIEVKRVADAERARYIASNSEEKRVCAEKNSHNRCVKWEMRKMYCAEKGLFGFGCKRWEEVQ